MDNMDNGGAQVTTASEVTNAVEVANAAEASAEFRGEMDPHARIQDQALECCSGLDPYLKVTLFQDFSTVSTLILQTCFRNAYCTRIQLYLRVVEVQVTAVVFFSI
jgi:hypothetical protein